MTPLPTSTGTVPTCSRCGAALPAGPLARLCPACLMDQGVASDPAPASVATWNELPSTPEQFESSPVLRFQAWQTSDRYDPGPSVFRFDGSEATGIADGERIRDLSPIRVDVSGTEVAQRLPRFLHLWFTHPLSRPTGEAQG